MDPATVRGVGAPPDPPLDPPLQPPPLGPLLATSWSPSSVPGLTDRWNRDPSFA